MFTVKNKNNKLTQTQYKTQIEAVKNTLDIRYNTRNWLFAIFST